MEKNKIIFNKPIKQKAFGIPWIPESNSHYFINIHFYFLQSAWQEETILLFICIFPISSECQLSSRPCDLKLQLWVALE